MAAIGGILGANLLAIIGTQFFVPENKAVDVQPWSHAGWYCGTLLFFVGAVTGQLRVLNGTSLRSHSRQPTSESTTSNHEASVLAEPRPDRAPADVLKCLFAGGLAGGFLGFLLGANLLVFWFSLAYSPFAPRQVVSSVKVVREQQPGSVFKRPVLRSSHPVSLLLCLAPAAGGALTGAAVAAVIALKYPHAA
jgi:hypothetical protein